MKKRFFVGLLLMPLVWAVASSMNYKTESHLQNSPLQSKSAGEKVYKKLCISCHMVDGSGVPGLNPPLIKTKYVLGDKAALIGIVLNGLENVDIDGDTYTNKMPPLKTVLSDQQVADVLTYLRNSFGNKASAITAVEVKVIRQKNK